MSVDFLFLKEPSSKKPKDACKNKCVNFQVLKLQNLSFARKVTILAFYLLETED